MRSISELAPLCLTPKKLSSEELLAITILLEAENQEVLGQIAVGCVIRNRMHKKKKSYAQIILQKLQFSCWNDPALAEKRVLAQPHGGMLAQCAWIAEGIISGALMADSSKGADHYFNPDLASPPWDNPKKRTAMIKDHVFLNLWG